MNQYTDRGDWKDRVRKFISSIAISLYNVDLRRKFMKQDKGKRKKYDMDDDFIEDLDAEEEDLY